MDCLADTGMSQTFIVILASLFIASGIVFYIIVRKKSTRYSWRGVLLLVFMLGLASIFVSNSSSYAASSDNSCVPVQAKPVTTVTPAVAPKPKPKPTPAQFMLLDDVYGKFDTDFLDFVEFPILLNDKPLAGDSLDPNTIRLSDFTGQFRDLHEVDNSIPAGVLFSFINPNYPNDPNHDIPAWLGLKDTNDIRPADPSFDISSLQPKVFIEFKLNSGYDPIFDTNFRLHYTVNSINGKTPTNTATISFSTPAYFVGPPQ